jgi:hypothetical protein
MISAYKMIFRGISMDPSDTNCSPVAGEGYIVYILTKRAEEYVVGVHKWVVYDTLEKAAQAVLEQWKNKNLGSYFWNGVGRDHVLSHKYEVGEHVKVLYGYSVFRHGYIARVA